MREALEETGLDVELVRALDTWSYVYPSNDRQFIGIFYLCHLKNAQTEVAISDERDYFEWKALGGLSELLSTFEDRMRHWKWEKLSR